MSLKILSLEDVAYDVELLERELKKAGIDYELKRVETKDQFLNALTEFRPEIILADYSLPQFSALEALKLLRQQKNTVPVILVTGSHSEEAAVECMKEGAAEYIAEKGSGAKQGSGRGSSETARSAIPAHHGKHPRFDLPARRTKQISLR